MDRKHILLIIIIGIAIMNMIALASLLLPFEL